MNREEFKDLVFPLTEREKLYRDNPETMNEYYKNLAKKGYKDSNGVFHFLTTRNMTKLDIKHSEDINSKKSINSSSINDTITIKKQTRYFDVPLHCHDFIGINYVYSGNTSIYTQNSNIPLKEGHLSLMDADFIHTTEIAHENDIILNVQIDPLYFTNSVIQRLGNSGVIARFLVESISAKKNRTHFMIFNCENNERLKNSFEDMFCECIEPNVCSHELIESYLNIIFIEMLRNYQGEQESNSNKNSKRYITEVLRFINENPCDCSLESLAKHFNFNPKYLSRIIKTSTGKTFKNLQLEIRMNKAESLIRNSDLPINIIAEECGFKNLNFFYKKFQEVYNTKPALYRKSLG